MSWYKYAAVGALAYATGVVTGPVLGAVAAGILIQKKMGKKKIRVVAVPVNVGERSPEEEEESTEEEEDVINE
jgi:hypothetical protein